MGWSFGSLFTGPWVWHAGQQGPLWKTVLNQRSLLLNALILWTHTEWAWAGHTNCPIPQIPPLRLPLTVLSIDGGLGLCGQYVTGFLAFRWVLCPSGSRLFGLLWGPHLSVCLGLPLTVLTLLMSSSSPVAYLLLTGTPDPLPQYKSFLIWAVGRRGSSPGSLSYSPAWCGQSCWAPQCLRLW
jgi:hypothetical protein